MKQNQTAAELRLVREWLDSQEKVGRKTLDNNGYNC
jgi:hypothetical protein